MISRTLLRIAGLVGVPVDLPVASHSHQYRPVRRINLLLTILPDWLQSRAEHHCKHVMDADYPDKALEPFLQQDSELPAPATPLPPEHERDGLQSSAGEDHSFAAYLGAVGGDISPALIGEEGMRAIASVARLLPGPLAFQTFGFECNLSHPEAAGDFLILVQARAGRAELAAGMPASLRDDPIWRRMQAFLEAWAHTQSALSSTVDHVWLEFDVSNAAGGPPTPSVFHGYRSVDSGSGGITAPSIDRQIEATCQAFQILTDRPNTPRVVEQLRACFELLPSDGTVFQQGAMIARDTDAFRLCVSFRNQSQLLPYLDRLGWAGERDRLQHLLGELEGRVDRLALNIDVTDSVLPKVGLECYLNRDARPPGQRWSPFLDFLVGSDIALEPKCRALLGYPGLLDFRTDAARRPAPLRRASELLGSAAFSVLLRGIHHVKLVVEPGQSIEAKAYLSARYVWVPPELLAPTP